jgi:DNA-binding transcriptional ArsR family regulator
MLDIVQSVSNYLLLVVAYPQSQMDALGDPARRAIVERLLHGPVAVGELARDFPISRPAVSQHLRVLKHASLVRDRAVGTRRLYELNPVGVDALRTYFDRFWNDALVAFKRAAEITAARNGEEEA